MLTVVENGINVDEKSCYYELTLIIPVIHSALQGIN